MPRNKLKTSLVLSGCAVWLAVLGWLDRATGYELGLFAFYTAPVAVVAWNLGQGPGIFVAFIASVIWYMADRYAGDRYSTPFYGCWNTGMHFTTFIINAVTFAKIKRSLDQRHELERALAEAREKVKQLAEMISLCSQYGKPEDPGFLLAKAEGDPPALPLEEIPAVLCDNRRERATPGRAPLPQQSGVGTSMKIQP